jgi:tRNA(fMet)-specific endonuclease VapC
MSVILDTTVVIAAERRGESPAELIKIVSRRVPNEDICLSAIGLTELVHGIYRANSPERRVRRRLFVDELRAAVRVYPFTEDASMIAGQVDGEAQAVGIVIPTLDLMIGATAISLGFSVMTTNVKHFSLIPGLNVIPF